MGEKSRVNTDAANAQMQQLTSAAEHASERLRAAEESQKKTKEDIVAMFGGSLDSVQIRLLMKMLDTCFLHGQSYGESSETVMQVREQAKMLAQMLKDVEETTKLTKERDARSEKREDEIRKRDEKMMRLTERQVAALEALTGGEEARAEASLEAPTN